MIYHRRGGGGAWASMNCWFNVLSCTQTMDNSKICHCLLFHEHGKQKLHAAISPVNEATTTHTLGLNFTNCYVWSSLLNTLPRVQIWNPAHPFVQFKYSVYGHKQASRHAYIYIRVLQCSPTSVGLAQAHPNQATLCPYVFSSLDGIHDYLTCIFE